MNEHDTSPHHHSLTSGPLRSVITIELHTHLATRLWQGRQANPEQGIYSIIGIPRFLTIMNLLQSDVITDNPYADMYMLILDKRLHAAREEMNTLIDSMKKVFSRLPGMLTVESCLSVQPARFPVFASSPLGFIAVYLLTDFDQLMRNVMLAHHLALINRAELNDLRQRGGTLIRSILVLAQHYRRIAVTRQDFREGNARAIAAEALAGPVPEDILNGSRRSAFAPALRSHAEEETAPGISETHMAAEPAELAQTADGVDDDSI